MKHDAKVTVFLCVLDFSITNEESLEQGSVVHGTECDDLGLFYVYFETHPGAELKEDCYVVLQRFGIECKED